MNILFIWAPAVLKRDYDIGLNVAFGLAGVSLSDYSVSVTPVHLPIQFPYNSPLTFINQQGFRANP